MADGPSISTPAPDLARLPLDELLKYGRELGLPLADDAPPGEALRRIRDRLSLLDALDREALLDIVRWARVPVRQSASKEHLAREIAGVRKMNFDGLSDAGLAALAQLRDIQIRHGEPRNDLIKRMKKAEPMRDWLRRQSRKAVAKWVTRYIDGGEAPSEEYQFLPDHPGAAPAAPRREDIVDRGIVTGIASRLRGAADEYVRAKLDEIEQRIDRKLDEIDRRLGEWRDREVANRLKIIRITIVASVLVALLSLIYKSVSVQMSPPASQPAAAMIVR